MSDGDEEPRLTGAPRAGRVPLLVGLGRGGDAKSGILARGSTRRVC